MPALTLFEHFIEAMAHGKHNLASDTFKLALTNTAPTAGTDETFTPGSLHPPPAAVNGYTSGGETLSVTSATQTSGVLKFIVADETITASGGDIGPFRYGIVYNDTASNDDLVGFVDYGSSVTIADGVDFQFDLSESDGIAQISIV